MKNALIIFVRNPELGKVKTRIAQTAGNEMALSIYKELLQHTRSVVKELACDKFVFYADYISENDLWIDDIFEKRLQFGNDLGQRMMNAFELLFSEGYDSVCIIGSDCISLAKRDIEAAFSILSKHDLVIGPSTDGGYYLLGMNKLHRLFFEDKIWSTDAVLPVTINNANQLYLTYEMLQTLSDIDTEEDWKNARKDLLHLLNYLLDYLQTETFFCLKKLLFF